MAVQALLGPSVAQAATGLQVPQGLRVAQEATGLQVPLGPAAQRAPWGRQAWASLRR